MNDLTTCRFHPDRPAKFLCQKSDYGYCDECIEDQAECLQPRQHCQFRPQCIIFFHYKENRRNQRQSGEQQ